MVEPSIKEKSGLWTLHVAKCLLRLKLIIYVLKILNVALTIVFLTILCTDKGGRGNIITFVGDNN